LVAQLNDDRYEAREQADRELDRLGEEVEVPLQRALAGSPSAEVRMRAELLLQKREGESRSLATLERHRELRALQVLEHLGNPEAIRLLDELKKDDPAGRLGRDAAAVLERLRRRNAGP
jgi:hypothetical protein